VVPKGTTGVFVFDEDIKSKWILEKDEGRRWI